MSRFDSVGMFWQDFAKTPAQKNQPTRARPLAPIPEPTWSAPSSFPDLSGAGTLVIDVETFDPNLRSKGPGDVRGDGHLVGIAVGTLDGHRWYFPMRHLVCPEQNLDPENVLAWARDHLTRPGQLKVGANLLYDLFHLQAEGVHVPGPYYDVQWVEAIVNETADSMALDALGTRYLGEGKTTSELYEWCARSYGGDPNSSQRANIYRAPPSLVGPYAEGDVDLPARVMTAQAHEIARWGVADLVALEHRLIPMLMAMRRQGVRVDVEKAARLNETLDARERQAQERLDEAAGRVVNVYANDSIAQAFDAVGVPYPTTAAGNPSFQKEWLEACEHPIAEQVLQVRRYGKAKGTFVDGYVRNGAVNGRVHALFHPLRGDENGAISGRFASSGPNLQNIPARDPELGPLVRGLFLPDEGCLWRSGDYSQVEYRLLAHYARGPGSDDVRAMYQSRPDTDYHVAATETIKRVTGIELGRKQTKNINFGLVYGMGKKKLCGSLGVDDTTGERLFAAYHEGVPFVKSTMDLAMNRARDRGYVRTLAGRVAKFDSWEPRDWELKGVVKASKDRDAVVALVQEYIKAAQKEGTRPPKPGVQRAWVHKALNRILQGSAADVIKRAMADMWDAGLCDVVGAPLVQVHDQLDFNDPCTRESDEAFAEIAHIMENSSPDVRVPLLVDWERGPTWGDLEPIR